MGNKRIGQNFIFEKNGNVLFGVKKKKKKTCLEIYWTYTERAYDRMVPKTDDPVILASTFETNRLILCVSVQLKVTKDCIHHQKFIHCQEQQILQHSRKIFFNGIALI